MSLLLFKKNPLPIKRRSLWAYFKKGEYAARVSRTLPVTSAGIPPVCCGPELGQQRTADTHWKLAASSVTQLSDEHSHDNDNSFSDFFVCDITLELILLCKSNAVSLSV